MHSIGENRHSAPRKLRKHLKRMHFETQHTKL